MADESVDQLARRLAESVPQGIQTLREDLEQNFRTILRSGLGRLDLVTREEFEVQQAVLARTREMLESLEERLEALQKNVEKSPAPKKRKSTKKKTQRKKTSGSD